MEKWQIKFRPDIPDAIKERQLSILEEAQKRIESGEVPGAISHDSKYFLVRTKLKNGEEVTTHIPKNTGDIVLDKEGQETVSIKDAIEAVQRFYPRLEKPDLKEAVRRLRERPEK